VSTAPPTNSATEARGLGRDFMVTLLAQVAVAVGGLLLYRLLALEKGAEGMASYGLVKQDVIFLFPAAMLGFQMGLPRYVALDRDQAGAAERYLLGAVAATGLAAAVVSGLLLVSQETTAAVFFGDEDRTHLVVPLITTLLATLAFEVVYGYYRGRSEFLLASAARALSVAAFPVVLLVVVPDEPIGRLINYMAFAALLTCVLLAAKPLARAVAAIDLGEVRRSVRTLLHYGWRRIPGDYASVTLLTVPPVLAAHVAPLGEVAFLTAGMYVLAVVTIAFQPVGLVFLPLLSRLCREDFEAARRWVGQLTACALHIAIFVTPQLVLFADVAVRSWLGPDFEDGGAVIRITVLPVAMYVFYLVLRSALDAAAVRAYNSRNNAVAVVAAGVAVALGLGLDVGDEMQVIAASFAIGITTLGLLTLGSINSLFGIRGARFVLPLAICLSAVAAAVAALVRFGLTGDDPPLGALVGVGALEVALGAAYVFALTRAGVTWPAAIRERFRARGA
jgi:O-antigen/teichoic acid export membrane protein